MDSITLLKEHVRVAHGWFLGTVKDLTEEQTNFLPPGTTHPIGAHIQHILQSEDGMINSRIGGGKSIWERDDWEGRSGLRSLLGADEASYRTFRMHPNALDEYRKAVWAATDACLDSITEAELDRELEFVGGTTVVGGMFGVFLNHTSSHVGEIAVAKGIQGLKGYPV